MRTVLSDLNPVPSAWKVIWKFLCMNYDFLFIIIAMRLKCCAKSWNLMLNQTFMEMLGLYRCEMPEDGQTCHENEKNDLDQNCSGKIKVKPWNLTWINLGGKVKSFIDVRCLKGSKWKTQSKSKTDFFRVASKIPFQCRFITISMPFQHPRCYSLNCGKWVAVSLFPRD